MNKEIIYNILNGYYMPKINCLCRDIPVEIALEKERKCEQLYENVHSTRLRLAKK